MRTIIIAAAAAALILAGSCFAENCELGHLAQGAAGTKAIVQGHFSSSFEHSGFAPCGSEREQWWLEAPKDYESLMHEIEKLGGSKYAAPNKRLFLRAEACVSSPGHYGHMGGYPRHIEVLKLIKYRPESAADCLTAPKAASQ